ncbi:hypothetical protein T492DRAFT_883208 [Pavlovales sp. CCMP2436]|nr:hypothetical protein T492DRAFT_883208 [Pavlovales sp. CCMP2436]
MSRASALGFFSSQGEGKLNLASAQSLDPGKGLMLLFVSNRSYLLLSLSAIPLLAFNRPWAIRRSMPTTLSHNRAAAAAAAAAVAGRRAWIWRVPVGIGVTLTLAAWAGWAVAMTRQPDAALTKGAAQPVGFSAEDVFASPAASSDGPDAVGVIRIALLVLWTLVTAEAIAVGARPFVRAHVAVRESRAAGRNGGWALSSSDIMKAISLNA